MLVLDANILIRAVLGSRVLSLLRKYADRVEFLAPDTALEEAREWLPKVLERRRLPVAPALEALDLIADLVQRIECEIYSQHEAVARQRIDKRDEDDCRCWRQRSRSIARSGQRMRTSSAAASRPGLRIEWNCIWRRLRNERYDAWEASPKCGMKGTRTAQVT